jgi:hypothetical protein
LGPEVVSSFFEGFGAFGFGFLVLDDPPDEPPDEPPGGFLVDPDDEPE